MRATSTSKIICTCALALAVAVAGVGLASANTVTDRKNDTRKLLNSPELDIVRVNVQNATGNRVKFKVKMRGRVDPDKSNTRPFILINTRGNDTSDFEYLVVGPRVFKKKGNDPENPKFTKVGANQFDTRKRTWIYRFKTDRIRVKRSFEWAVLTAKGKTEDLAPNLVYAKHKL